MVLLTGRLEKVVVAQQRNRPPHSFQIVTPSPAGATINPKAGVPPKQLVPVGQVTGHMPVFVDSLPVGGLIGLPETKRVHVKILTVQVDALFFDQAVDMVHQPLPSLGIS